MSYLRDMFGSQFTFPVTSFPNKMAFSLFLAFVILQKLVTFSTSEETCEKIDTCSCKLKNGSTVSLKPVDGSGSNPRYNTFTSLSVQARSFYAYVVIISKSGSARNFLYLVFELFAN